MTAEDSKRDQDQILLAAYKRYRWLVDNHIPCVGRAGDVCQWWYATTVSRRPYAKSYLATR